MVRATAQDLVMGAGGEAELFHGGFQYSHCLGLECTELAELARGHAAVDQWVFVAEALDLAGTRLQHLGAEVCGGCAGDISAS